MSSKSDRRLAYHVKVTAGMFPSAGNPGTGRTDPRMASVLSSTGRAEGFPRNARGLLDVIAACGLT